jgi:hypothetical protein
MEIANKDEININKSFSLEELNLISLDIFLCLFSSLFQRY